MHSLDNLNLSSKFRKILSTLTRPITHGEVLLSTLRICLLHETNNRNSEALRLKIGILESGGVAEYPMLVDKNGEPLPDCKYLSTKYGDRFRCKLPGEEDPIWLAPTDIEKIPEDLMRLVYEDRVSWATANPHTAIFESEFNYYTGEFVDPQVQEVYASLLANLSKGKSEPEAPVEKDIKHKEPESFSDNPYALGMIENLEDDEDFY